MRFRSLSVLLSTAVLGLGIFPIVSTIAAPQPNSPLVAQKVPVGTVGRIAPNKPVRLVVQNGTPAALFAGISGGSRVELPVSGSNAFVFDSTPVNVFVYPAGTAMSLKYATTISGNTVTVRVTQVGGDNPGDGSININTSGSVYVF